MPSILAARASRYAIRVLTVVTLPLCLVSCTGAQEPRLPAAELRAATGSNLFAVSPEQLYEVTDLQILAPTDAASLGNTLKDQVAPEGYMMIEDGVITQAELSVNITGLPEALFVLTEPTVLYREGHKLPVVHATGTLIVAGIKQRSTQLVLTPGIINKKLADFDVSFAVPHAAFITGSLAVLDEVSAHISLTAAPNTAQG